MFSHPLNTAKVPPQLLKKCRLENKNYTNTPPELHKNLQRFVTPTVTPSVTPTHFFHFFYLFTRP